MNSYPTLTAELGLTKYILYNIYLVKKGKGW